MSEVPLMHTVATKTTAPPKETDSSKAKVEELKTTIDQSKGKLENLVKLYDRVPLGVKNELDGNSHTSSERYLFQSGELLYFFEEISDNSDNKILNFNSSEEVKTTINEKINFLNEQQKGKIHFHYHDIMTLNVNENISNEELKNLIDGNIKNIKINRRSFLSEECGNEISEICGIYMDTKDKILNEGSWRNEPDMNVIINGNDIFDLLKLSIENNLKPIIDVTQEQYDRKEQGHEVFRRFLRKLNEMKPSNQDIAEIDIGKWQEIKASDSFNEIFGVDVIQKKDELVLEKLLQNSLFDNTSPDTTVEALAYYPEQAIKNLVLIGCNKNREFKHKHVVNALSTLSKRDDWSEILDKTIKQEPGLSSLKPILLDWIINGKEPKDNLSSLQEASKSFLISQIETADEIYAEVAINGLSFTDKLNYLVSKEVISGNDFTNTEKIMAQVNEGLYEKELYGKNIKDFGYRANDSVNNLIMVNRFGISVDKVNKNMDHDSSVNFLRKFEILSDELLSNSNLTEGDIWTLTDESTKNIFMGKQLPPEHTKELLDIFITIEKNALPYGVFKEYITKEMSSPDWTVKLPVIINKFISLSQSSCGELLKHIKKEGVSQIVDKDLFLTIEEYNRLVGTEKNETKSIIPVLNAIVEGKIGKERANELPGNKMFEKLLLSDPNNTSFAALHPDIFLNTDTGLNILDKTISSGSIDFLKLMNVADISNIVKNDLFSIIEKYVVYKNIQNPNNNDNVVMVLKLIANGKISKERANELPGNKMFEKLLSGSGVSSACNFPKMFLETDIGLEFFDKFRIGGIFSIDRDNEFDKKIGKIFRNINNRKDFIMSSSAEEIVRLDKLLSSDNVIEIGKENWKQLLFAYVRNFNEDFYSVIPKLSKSASEKIKGLFSNQGVSDFCLNSMKAEWQNYLKSGNPDEIPFSLSFISHFINLNGGAGNLSQIQSLNELICSVDKTFTKKTTVEKTKNGIYKGLAQIENRFEKERWSNEDRVNFYNMSRDILEASPSIFTDYLNLFDKLSPSQMEHFYKEIYPLYRTKIILMERRGGYDNKAKKGEIKKLSELREEVRTLTESIDSKNANELFTNKKAELITGISNDFKERFGIIKIPENFDSEQIRSISNIAMYLSNLNHRTTEKEDILAYYLSLMINNKWSDFRSGTVFDPKEFLTEEKEYQINNLLEERTSLNILTAENLGIKTEDTSEFIKLLQEETSNLVVGNIETIDVKLASIIHNLKSLEDPDLYPEKIDKQRLELLLEYGNKSIGAVAAKMYQELNNPSKKIEFNEEESNIKDKISNILKENKIDFSTVSIKSNFQDGIKPLATVVNLLNHVGENNTETEINNLRNLLIPSQEIIEIFKRLNENFTPTSGAIAISQDLTYLDNLVNKNEDKLEPAEKDVLNLYTSSIRGKLIQLETIYVGIIKKFSTLREGNVNKNNPQLIEKLEEINRIINSQATQQPVTSIMSNDLNTIMENIRECLSCKNQGCNNDTDLSFGDMNKFFLYSQSETQKTGSIADQIIFVEPVTREDGSKEISFVLDRIYGINTPTILENHINTILKKQKMLKQKFPEAKIGIFVPNIVLSGALSPEMLINKLKENNNIDATLETVDVDIIKSAMSDHYIEFGGNGDARKSGVRQVRGIRLSL